MKHILVVEDHGDRADHIVLAVEHAVDLLGDGDLEVFVDVATTAAEALRVLAEGAGADLVLLDYDLDLDGTVPLSVCGTGAQVANALSGNVPVVVHSKNLSAASDLVAALLSAGHPVATVPIPREDPGRGRQLRMLSLIVSNLLRQES